MTRRGREVGVLGLLARGVFGAATATRSSASRSMARSSPPWRRSARWAAKLPPMSRSLTPVNRVGVDERAAALGRRSIKTTAKREGIRLATSMIDLTTLEGADTPGKVRHLCAKAVVPGPAAARDPVVRRGLRLPVAGARSPREALRGHRRRRRLGGHRLPGRPDVARRSRSRRRATRSPRARREIDMVISREAYLRGDDARVAREIEAVKEACGERAPEGDPRDRRAADLRARPPRLRSWRSTPAPT